VATVNHSIASTGDTYMALSHWFKGQGQSLMTTNLVKAVASEPMKVGLCQPKLTQIFALVSF